MLTSKCSPIILIIILLTATAGRGQQSRIGSGSQRSRNIPAMHSAQFVGGISNHGSGDLLGWMFAGEFTRYLSRKFSLTYSVRATVNSDSHTILVHNGTETTDASVRFTTGGVQLGLNGGLSLLNSARHELMVKLGAFGRYQSASNGSDGYYLYPPAVTGVPNILVGYDNKTSQETIAFGGMFQLQYNFTFNNDLFIGLQPGLQADTNGDLIVQGGLVVGKRF